MNASKTKLPSEPDWKDMKIDDMPNSDMRMVAEILGVKTAVELMRNFEGTTLIVPKYKKSISVSKFIIANYDGKFSTVKRIVRQCGLSQRRVLEIIAQHKKNGTIKQ